MQDHIFNPKRKIQMWTEKRSLLILALSELNLLGELHVQEYIIYGRQSTHLFLWPIFKEPGGQAMVPLFHTHPSHS